MKFVILYTNKSFNFFELSLNFFENNTVKIGYFSDILTCPAYSVFHKNLFQHFNTELCNIWISGCGFYKINAKQNGGYAVNPTANRNDIHRSDIQSAA